MAGKHLYAALHPIGSHGVAGSPTVVPTSADAAGSGWHTARIDWVPGGVTYYLDGAKVVTLTKGVPTTPFHLVFQVESQLSSTPPPDSTAGHVQVDWVRIYRYQPYGRRPADALVRPRHTPAPAAGLGRSRFGRGCRAPICGVKAVRRDRETDLCPTRVMTQPASSARPAHRDEIG